SSACAIIGMCSEICVPGILVGIGLKSPRMLAGAFGFGSQMSMWLGPPCRKTTNTGLAGGEPPPPTNLAVFCASRYPARFRPKRPIEPTRSSSRRVGPSQVRHRFPGMTSMTTFLRLPVVQEAFAIEQRPEQILRTRRAARSALQVFDAAIHL